MEDFDLGRPPFDPFFREASAFIPPRTEPPFEPILRAFSLGFPLGNMK